MSSAMRNPMDWFRLMERDIEIPPDTKRGGFLYLYLNKWFNEWLKCPAFSLSYTKVQTFLTQQRENRESTSLNLNEI